MTAIQIQRDPFKAPKFSERLFSLLRLDFYRLFHTPLLYIMLVVSALIPALVLSMAGTGEEASVAYTNVWQVIEMASGGNAGMGVMDMATMCNINMVFIFVAIFVSVFISHDYGSGFIKNIFTVHPQKVDYVLSKSAAGFFGGACMVLCYCLGAFLVGASTGKSFSLGDANAFNAILCILSKISLMMLFVPLYVTVAVFFKQRLWLSILGAFAVGILFYPAAMLAAPLDANLLNLILCLVGGAAFGGAFAGIATLVLNKRDLA